MIKLSPSELADRLVAGFDRQAEIRLDHALIKLLRSLGLERFRSEEIAWKVDNVVARLLQERQPEDLPFRLCDGGKRLVGKARIGVRDNADTAFARNAETLASQLLNTLLDLTPNDFEVVAAASMVLSGAPEMKALCTGDEGGIDFYGRLPIRQPSATIPQGLIHTTLLPKELLVLGQAKLYQRQVRVGRPDIQLFKGQVQDCMQQYAGNQRPPSHRVPESYYNRDEPFLGVFVTTASFAETATACVEASGIVLIPGVKLSQFLAFHHVGIAQDDKGFRFDQNDFAVWLSAQRSDLTQTGSSVSADGE